MKDLIALLLHLLTTIARFLGARWLQSRYRR